MHIDWTHFTTQTAFADGLVIGVAAAVFALLLGRFAGNSGIVAGVLRPERGDAGWRLALIAGMLLAPATYGIFDAIAQLPASCWVPPVGC
jgi:hypothetical protein